MVRSTESFSAFTTQLQRGVESEMSILHAEIKNEH
jgi:hypothetical protein